MTYKLATLGIWELLIILFIVVLIFGAGKLPQLGDAMGKAIRNFRQSFRGGKDIEAESRRIDAGKEQAALPPQQQRADTTATGEPSSAFDRRREG